MCRSGCCSNTSAQFGYSYTGKHFRIGEFEFFCENSASACGFGVGYTTVVRPDDSIGLIILIIIILVFWIGFLYRYMTRGAKNQDEIEKEEPKTQEEIEKEELYKYKKL